jgi:hypothetical protein
VCLVELRFGILAVEESDKNNGESTYSTEIDWFARGVCYILDADSDLEPF